MAMIQSVLFPGEIYRDFFAMSCKSFFAKHNNRYSYHYAGTLLLLKMNLIALIYTTPDENENLA